MGFTSVVELPLQLHPVDPDPFLDPRWSHRPHLGGVRSGAGDPTAAPLGEGAVAPTTCAREAASPSSPRDGVTALLTDTVHERG